MDGGVSGLSGSDFNKQVQEGEGSWGGKSNSSSFGDIPVSGRLLTGRIWFPKTSEIL